MQKTRKIKQGKPEVRHEVWINKDTGEERDFVVSEKNVYKDVNFWKIWLPDLLRIMGYVGNKKIIVLTYVLDNISPYDNTFVGTVREIAEKTKSSPTTVQKVLNVLIKDSLFLVRIRTGQYIVNPDVLTKGSHTKRMGLLVKYNKTSSEGSYMNESGEFAKTK